MRVNQAAVNALACTIAIESATAAAASSERNWSRELQLSLPLSTNEDERGRGEKGRGEKGRGERGRGERRKKKLEKIAAALRSETSKKSGATIDDGLMGRSAILAKSSKSSKKFVDCMDGNTVEDPGVTCAEACDGDCCEGDRSCEGFTGLVAKDGSCNERRACRNAKIGVVSGGSCQGELACSLAEISVVSGQSCVGT